MEEPDHTFRPEFLNRIEGWFINRLTLQQSNRLARDRLMREDLVINWVPKRECFLGCQLRF
jgi:hypothetical protein